MSWPEAIALAIDRAASPVGHACRLRTVAFRGLLPRVARCSETRCVTPTSQWAADDVPPADTGGSSSAHTGASRP